ncbi:M23 family metallopeptidase [Paenibacillus cremeus]|uniref:M23 family metallopeptidase n=1 Tax=Paenibacillus cremeus TaxID=2163881 RepID=A0A559KFH1_9BACL|nr:M23 family metallopeptidase [Paenibacillus cremeus]TVY10871.1 M23 family metallopeptidase [Paenibacillus cremeus]
MDSQQMPRRWAKRLSYILGGSVLAAVCLGIILYEQRQEQAASVVRPPVQAQAVTVAAPAPRELLDFRMTDFDHGRIRYADGMLVTTDGGAHWQEAASSSGTTTEERGSDIETWGGTTREDKESYRVQVGVKEYPVKQWQFLTDRIGWASLEGGAELGSPLVVTVDGGRTWQAEVTASVMQALQEAKQRQAQVKKEAGFYASADAAKAVMAAHWTLFPATASPGDVVLVRHDQPGEVTWQGQSYPLKPFGAGYFAYLPISLGVKPGNYPIGDQTLKIQSKKFETQYLQVTQQMEAMKQDTKRIQADQVRIDAARSKPEPEFLFQSAFIAPIQGILTTPYGYTRYVNGKFDSSHLALDLAAKEGTPIKATNDGVVALADSLYLTGNSIYIDHGMGLFSQYAHLSELRVKTGDRVKKGDIIGLVGTTGFSTGPHLHFTFWANNIPANPNLFFDTTPFQWLNRQGG